MPSPRARNQTTARTQEHIQYHKDGTIWARGPLSGGKPSGYWEWFRKDGVRLRSGYFENGEQVGEWTTYDRTGAVYKVTRIRPKPAGAAGKGFGKRARKSPGKSTGRSTGKKIGKNAGKRGAGR